MEHMQPMEHLILPAEMLLGYYSEARLGFQ
jgi:hypothetical protein